MLRTRACILTTHDHTWQRRCLHLGPLMLAMVTVGCYGAEPLDSEIPPASNPMDTTMIEERELPADPSTMDSTEEEVEGQGESDTPVPSETAPSSDTPVVDEPLTPSPEDPAGETPEVPDPGESETPEVPETTTPSTGIACSDFESDVLPIVESACASCHSAGLALGGLNLSPESAFTVLKYGNSVVGAPFVVPGDPDASYLMTKLGPNPPVGATMPPPPDMLTEAQVATIRDWISAGAQSGEYGDCEVDTNKPDGPETYAVDFQVNALQEVNGNLIIALFDTYPPVAMPVVVKQVNGVVFPSTVTVQEVPAGAYIAEVILDVMPFDFQTMGDEDLMEIAPLTVPANGPISVTFTPASSEVPENLCGECAPGLFCGANPNAPETQCTGAPGTCGDVTFAGTCASDTVLLYCSDDEGAGTPISVDCSLDAELPFCGEVSPGAFGCVAEPTTEAPVLDEEPEEVVDPSEPTDAPEPSEPDAEGPCGVCAPGLTCGLDPSLPENFCSGEAGACDGLTYAGTCLSGDVLTYCSSDEANGVPLSIDCSNNEELSACGETSPGYFDCVAPSDVPPAPPEEPEEPEEVVDAAYALFTQAHPILEASCSGWLCHQYSGFAQPDLDAAYGVVLEKSFADNILDAIVEGRMPAGNFGLPLCTGDPSVDTDPKCLTQEQLDIVTAWVDAELGYSLVTPEEDPSDEAPSDDVPADAEGLDDEAPEVEAAPTTFAQIHPILEAGCSGFFCHSGGFAGQDLDASYNAIVSKDLCEPILDAVQAGVMPPGKGCTGDPVQDSNIEGCLNVTQHALLLDWVTGGDEPCPGPE